MANLASKLESKLASEGLKNLSDSEIRRFAASIGQEAVDTLETSALAKRFKDFVGSKTAPAGSARMATDASKLPAKTVGAKLSNFDRPVSGQYTDPSNSTALARADQPIIDAEYTVSPPAPSAPGGVGVGLKTAGALGAAGAAAAGVGSALSEDPTADASMLPADLRPPGATPEPAPSGSAGASTEISTQAAAPAAPVPSTYTPAQIDTKSIKPAAKIDAPKYEAVETALKEEAAKFGTDADGQSYGAQLNSQDQEALKAWNERRTALESDYAAAKERLGWGEAAEIFGKALARIGAGLYGIKTGLDLSGAKFDPSDWSSRYDRAAGDYKISLDQAEKATQAKRDSIDSLRKEYTDYRNRRDKLDFQKGSDTISVDKANQDAEQAWQRSLQSAQQFNANETNEAAKSRATEENRILEAKVKADIQKAEKSGQLSPEQKAKLSASALAYKQDLQAYKKRLQSLADVKEQLPAIQTLSGKQKEQALKAIVTKIPGGMGAESIWEQAEAAKDPLKWDDAVDYAPAMIQKIIDNPPKAPTWEDYVGQSSATAPRSPGAEQTVTLIDIKTGIPGEIPAANVEAALKSGKFKRATE